MRLLAMALAVCTLSPLTSCGDNDTEPSRTDRISSAEVTFTYTVSEEMLRYFNITAEYTNANGEKVGRHMDSPILTVTTTVTRFPAKVPLTFSISRTDVPAPTNAPTWSESMSVVVKKYFSPSGALETSSKNEATALTPTPANFPDWANTYMNRMSTGYTVNIDTGGKVTFEP